MRTAAIVVAVFILIQSCLAGSPAQWRNRTVYQLLTDRFARNSDKDNSPCDVHNYCGGTWRGVINHLDYIAGMGFDAIWISPIPQQYPGGYHGYWMTDLYAVNENFGTEDDLKQLVQQAHSRGMWVMLDIVGNHVGPVGNNYSAINPFNQATHYHDCSICPSNCQIQNWGNQPEVEWCRLAGLPDLNQAIPYVNQTMCSWVAGLINEYGFDGLRIDTTPEVPKQFWTDFLTAAGNPYAVGEVFNGDIGYVSSYQYPAGPMPGVLSYPMFFTIRDVFGAQHDMNELQDEENQYNELFADPSLLGNFVDNHDNARFLNSQSDIKLYQNALVYSLMSTGIPIVYYGTEQAFNGANDPFNREPLWQSQFNTQSQMYQFISTVVNFRKKFQVWQYKQVQRYAQSNFYAFSRGPVFVAMTNGGSGQDHVLVTITYHPYSNGQKLCNLFFPTTDCLVVQNNQFDVYLEKGECKIYYPV